MLDVSNIIVIVRLIILIICTILLAAVYYKIRFKGYLLLLIGNFFWLTAIVSNELGINSPFSIIWELILLVTITLYSLGIYLIYIAQIESIQYLDEYYLQVVKSKKVEEEVKKQ